MAPTSDSSSRCAENSPVVGVTSSSLIPPTGEFLRYYAECVCPAIKGTLPDRKWLPIVKNHATDSNKL